MFELCDFADSITRHIDSLQIETSYSSDSRNAVASAVDAVRRREHVVGSRVQSQSVEPVSSSGSRTTCIYPMYHDLGFTIFDIVQYH